MLTDMPPPTLGGQDIRRTTCDGNLPLSQLVYLPSQLVLIIQDDGPLNWCVLGDRVMYVGSLQIRRHQKLADFNPNKKPLPVFWRFDIPHLSWHLFSTKQKTNSLPWNVFFFPMVAVVNISLLQGVGGVGCFGGEFQEISWSFHGLSCSSHLGTCLDFAGFVGFLSWLTRFLLNGFIVLIPGEKKTWDHSWNLWFCNGWKKCVSDGKLGKAFHGYLRGQLTYLFSP